MKIVAMIARILLGLIFLVFGMNTYLHFIPTGQMPAGTAGQFLSILISTGYDKIIGLFQVAPAILLLFNRFVSLALALLAPVVFNIAVFHALMEPSGLPVAGVVILLWFVVAYPVRSAFAGLLQRQA